MNYEMNCITMHKCTEMSSQPDIQNFNNLRPEPERNSLRRRDKKLNADSEATSPRVSRSMKDASSSNVCTDLVELFCTLCICIILCDTSKASENLTFILKRSLILSSVFVIIIICCLGAMKIKGSIEQMALYLFQNCDVREEVRGSFK